MKQSRCAFAERFAVCHLIPIGHVEVAMPSNIVYESVHCGYCWLTDQGSAAVGDSKKRVELVALKAAVEQVPEEYAFSQRRAGGGMTMAGSSYRYQTERWDEPVGTRCG